MERHKYETGSGAIDYSFEEDYSVYITSIRLHLSAAGGAAEDFSVSIDSALGAEYDVNHLALDMTAVQNLVWRPEDGPLYVAKGDKVSITYANSNSRTYGLEILYR